MKNKIYKKFIAVLFSLALPAAAQAATYTWTGNAGSGTTGDNWSTAGNWAASPGGAPVTADPTTIVTMGSSSTAATDFNSNVDGSYELNGLFFHATGTNAFNLTGNTLNFYGGGDGTNTGVIDNNTASTSHPSATINNDITLNVGTVVGGNSTSTMQIRASGGNLTFAGNLNLNGLVLVVRPSNGHTDTFNGVISGQANGSNSIQFNAATGTDATFINGANTYSAVTSIFTGIVNVGVSDVAGVSGAFGSSTNTITIGTSGGATVPTILVAGTNTLGRNFQVASGLSTGGAPNASITTVTLGAAAGANSVFSGNIALGTPNSGTTTYEAAALTVTAPASSTVNFKGTITRNAGTVGNSDNITKTGAGTVIFSNNVANNGTTAVSAGSLLMGNGTTGSAVGSTSANLTVASGATLGGYSATAVTTPTVVGSGSVANFAINGNLIVGTGTDAFSRLNLQAAPSGTGSFTNANLSFNLSSTSTDSNLLNLGTTEATFTNTVLTLNLLGTNVVTPGSVYTLITTQGDYFNLSTTEINGQAVITGGLSIGNSAAFGASVGGFATGAYAGSYLFLNGDDIDVQVVPEPGTWSLLAIGMAVLISSNAGAAAMRLPLAIGLTDLMVSLFPAWPGQNDEGECKVGRPSNT